MSRGTLAPLRVTVTRSAVSVEVSVDHEVDATILDELQRAMEAAAGVRVRRQPPLKLYATAQESTMILAERAERWLRRKGCQVVSAER